MRKYRRFQPADYVVFALLAIGILSLFLHNPGTYIIPIAVFGTIYLLYKFPPDRWRKPSYPSRRDRERERERARRKSNFRVIPGTKHDDDEDRPRYH